MYGYEILHEQIAENLINNIRQEVANQAYIFEGERGVGSKECAKLFAGALVCKNTPSAPCTTCNACIMAKAESHPDIYELTPADGKRNISVDQIRSVVTDAYTKPYESKKKVYIIAYGDDMNEQAQNAFLKVLEEPPEYAVFVILAENNESLLPTIRSRCTSIRFNPVADKKVEEYIKKNYPERLEAMDFLVQYAGGVVGDIEKILNAENFVPLRRESLEKLEALLSERKLDAYQVAEFLEENKEDADLILRFWQGFLRDMMLILQGAKNLVKSTDFIDNLINLANKTQEEKVARAIDEVLLAQQMRKRYVNLKALSLRLAFSIKNRG
ncbi:MAG: DNA polymerase III subunit [Clostridia bacterium]|nr:DNA polymerase III subunit [Clostridia bacterium]